MVGVVQEVGRGAPHVEEVRQIGGPLGPREIVHHHVLEVVHNGALVPAEYDVLLPRKDGAHKAVVDVVEAVDLGDLVSQKSEIPGVLGHTGDIEARVALPKLVVSGVCDAPTVELGLGKELAIAGVNSVVKAPVGADKLALDLFEGAFNQRIGNYGVELLLGASIWVQLVEDLPNCAVTCARVEEGPHPQVYALVLVQSEDIVGTDCILVVLEVAFAGILDAVIHICVVKGLHGDVVKGVRVEKVKALVDALDTEG